MSTAFERGIVLFRQGRPDLAEREFRQALSEGPDDAFPHAFLALCLAEKSRNPEALAEADEAMRLAPDEAFCHSVRGRILFDLGRLDEAEAAAKEAAALDPADAEHRVLLGQVAIGRRRWPDALENADAALALDAQSLSARNLRAIALTQMGRKSEAEATLGEALADDPEDPVTQANQGWVCLHQNDPKRALEHFREALRLDPNLDWARAGIVEALKAKHLLYRLMLQFFLWIGRQGRVAQIGLVLAIVFGRSLLAWVDEVAPGYSWLVRPLMILSFAFLILTWIASPVFNLLLRFNRFGRMALSKEQRTESTWIGGCFLIALAGLIGYLATASQVSFLVMTAFGLLLFPLAVTFRAPAGPTRLLLAAGTAVLFLMDVPILAWSILGPSSPFGGLHQAHTLFYNSILGCAGSTWISLVLSQRARGG